MGCKMKRKTRYVILGLLWDENLSGYEMKKKIDQEMQFFWKESYGQLYPELHAMLAAGLLHTCPCESGVETRNEKIRYGITEAGRATFSQWMEEDNQTDSIRSELLLKVFLSTDDYTKTLQRHIEQFHQQHVEQLKLFAMFRENLLAHINEHCNHKYILQVLDLGIRQSEMYRDWCAQLLAQLLDGYLTVDTDSKAEKGGQS